MARVKRNQVEEVKLIEEELGAGVFAHRDGDNLILRIDLTANYGDTSSGKSYFMADTEGMVNVECAEDDDCSVWMRCMVGKTKEPRKSNGNGKRGKKVNRNANGKAKKTRKRK